MVSGEASDEVSDEASSEDSTWFFAASFTVGGESSIRCCAASCSSPQPSPQGGEGEWSDGEEAVSGGRSAHEDRFLDRLGLGGFEFDEVDAGAELAAHVVGAVPS